MKSLLATISLVLCFTMDAHAHSDVKRCALKVSAFVSMPNGPMDFPIINVKRLKAKGYNSVVTEDLRVATGEYYMRSKVECGLHVFNPWVSQCTTKVTVYNSDSDIADQGIATSVAVGRYLGSLEEAIDNLMDCDDL